jgi:hypothetical protein
MLASIHQLDCISAHLGQSPGRLGQSLLLVPPLRRLASAGRGFDGI